MCLYHLTGPTPVWSSPHSMSNIIYLRFGKENFDNKFGLLWRLRISAWLLLSVVIWDFWLPGWSFQPTAWPEKSSGCTDRKMLGHEQGNIDLILLGQVFENFQNASFVIIGCFHLWDRSLWAVECLTALYTGPLWVTDSWAESLLTGWLHTVSLYSLTGRFRYPC